MKRRWYNIFKEDSKSFIFAMDHGVVMDVYDKLKNPGEIIKQAVAGGIDSMITTFGIAEQYKEEMGNIGLLLRIDGGTTVTHPSGKVFDKYKNTFSIEDAVRAGADGVICLGITGLENEDIIVQNLAKYYSECKKWGLVFCAEMVPGGFIEPTLGTIENIAAASRLGAEYGADFIKTSYVGDSKAYKETVVDGCYKPVLVLGGGGNKTDEELLKMVKEAMNSGVKGVAIGRNIWRHKNVKKICSAISKIIHEDASVNEALEELQ